MRRTFATFAVLFIAVCSFAAPRTEKIGSFSGEASDSIKAALSTEGYRVYLPNTLVGCEIWLATDISIQTEQAKDKDASGANYPQFAQSQFLGVITFPKGGGSDFRGQQIRPGSYTMRYQLLPNDGNHLGVAPNPDMVLLIPIAEDSDPAVHYDFAKLVELSANAARSAHPAAFEMMPPESGEPSVTQTDDGWVVFHGSIGSKGKPIPIALVVKGSAAQ